MADFRQKIKQGIPQDLPTPRGLEEAISHAPARNLKGVLNHQEEILALENALRYFPQEWHEELAAEFYQELKDHGRIYMHRFRPTYKMYARPIEDYPARTKQAAAIMLMIQNNLDPLVAKHPHELITYGGNGAVFQNWAQYLLCMKYLSEMTEEQTLVLYSGHPLGLFPSHTDAPRVVVTNGMMIPNYSSKEDWNKYNALGVTSYGQMTAGSFMYIGPQGIVHGTTITLLNAGRLKGLKNLKGEVFVTSGLGGMSGAQAIAAIVCECIGVLSEVDNDAIEQRIADGYIHRENVYSDIDQLLDRIEVCKEEKKGVALVHHGNIVELWEAIVARHIHIALGSDQTSLHNIDDLGYCPIGYTFEESKELLLADKPKFDHEIKETLRRHVKAINTMSDRGMYFWDYGNAFLKEAGVADADVWEDKENGKYKYPSYVQDIMGPMCFDYGFGPFRWVCAGKTMEDLRKTDEIAADVLRNMRRDAPEEIQSQLDDNINWIEHAEINIPIVGSYARILYADAEGRMKIALAFNEALAKGDIKSPIVLGRDHHDVSGTDSPFRETSNIYDGSSYTADMAVHNVIGDSFRGATWVSIHNGGGVGWGEVMNGGFGMVIDGSEACAKRIKSMLHWDVNNGIARRNWARNPHAVSTIKRAMKEESLLTVTIPELADKSMLQHIISKY